jgi:hypothetical protein
VKTGIIDYLGPGPSDFLEHPSDEVLHRRNPDYAISQKEM